MAIEVGFIGIGKMGRPMSERLLAAGFSLHVHNRSRGPVDDLVA
ncbi:MAG: NAD(P)-binding domain-containing protein, partial [Myxococcales bacterium]